MKKNCLYPNGHTCFAEKQTHGKGMQGKTWITTKNNICFSMAWSYENHLSNIHMLNFLVAIKLVNALKNNGYLNIKIKWPNDLIFNGLKLAGILIESVYKKNSKIYLVIGVGINIEVDIEDKKKIDQKVSDLISVNPEKLVNKNKLAAYLAGAVAESLFEFAEYECKKLSEEWNKLDNYYNVTRIVSINNRLIKVKLLGINETGKLCCFHDKKINLYNINEVKIIKDEFLCN